MFNAETYNWLKCLESLTSTGTAIKPLQFSNSISNEGVKIYKNLGQNIYRETCFRYVIQPPSKPLHLHVSTQEQHVIELFNTHCG